MNKFENFEPENNVNLIDEDFQSIKAKSYSRTTKNIIKKLFSDIKYSWEVDGDRILRDDKFSVTKEDRKIIKKLILKKVPANKRAKLWLLISGAKRDMHNNIKYYKAITEYFPSTNPSPYENQIELDLKRTYPEEKFFQSVETLRKMKNVLLAYSRRNVSIGYCQGFNFIVGRLLKVFDKEEEAFWVFVQIIENILPLNYYCEMVGTIIDQSILKELINKYIPTLFTFFENSNFELSPISLPWFISLFSQSLSYEVGLIIWDVLFLEGSATLFKTSLAILKMLKKDILSKTGFEEIYSLLDYSIKGISDTNMLLYYLLVRKFDQDLENNNLIKQRSSLETDVVEKIKKSREITQKILSQKYRVGFQNRVSFVQENIICNKEWQICIYDIEYKFNFSSFLILQIKDSDKFEMNEDYFIDLNKTTKNSKNLFKFNNIDYTNLLIERREHKCELNTENFNSSLDEGLMSKSIDLREKLMTTIEEKDTETNIILKDDKQVGEENNTDFNKLKSSYNIPTNLSVMENDRDLNTLINSYNSKCIYIVKLVGEIMMTRINIKKYLQESSYDYSKEIKWDDI